MDCANADVPLATHACMHTYILLYLFILIIVAIMTIIVNAIVSFSLELSLILYHFSVLSLTTKMRLMISQLFVRL